MHWIIDPYPECAFRGVRDAQKLLSAGFTTVHEAGGRYDVAMKAAIDGTDLDGPRIIPAWMGISRTGGHGDCHTLPQHWVRDQPGAALIADGVDELRHTVRKIHREGALWVKVWASGAVIGSGPDDPRHRHYSDAELSVIIEEAHAVDMTVSAHCTSADAVRQCLRAGFDAIEHGYRLDDDLCQEMKERGVRLVSTLSTLEHSSRYTGVGSTPDKRARASEYLQWARESIAMAHASGVELVMGSDTFSEPLTPYDRGAMELVFMHQGAGIPIETCLKAATLHPARLIGMDDRLGTVETGKLADLVVLAEGSPLDSVEHLVGPEKMWKILKEGSVVGGSSTTGR